MTLDEPLFEVRSKDGHVWLFFEDGRTEGFPEGALVINRAWPRLVALRSRIVNLERMRPRV